jgi:hypothetical protein
MTRWCIARNLRGLTALSLILTLDCTPTAMRVGNNGGNGGEGGGDDTGGKTSPPPATGGKSGSNTGGATDPGTGGSTGGSTGGGTGGSAGKPDAAAGGSGVIPDAAPRDAVVVTGLDAKPAARPVAKAGDKVIYTSAVAQWEIYDPAVYTQYKTNFDEVIRILDRGYAGILQRLGPTNLTLPIRVVIEPGGCCGGWTGGGDVGYAEGDFKDKTGMDWIRGVVLGEVTNAWVGNICDNWPSDWWVDGVWYFPGFVVVEVMKDVTTPEIATSWEVREKYPTYPIYRLFREILAEKGWEGYQDFFASVKADKMQWGQIGANPSAIKTNYIIAYMSMAHGTNLGARFVTAKANGTDPTVVQAIMDARKAIADATTAGKSTTAAWAAFRKGNYQMVKGLLP